MNGLDHANLGFGCTSSDDERKLGQSVDLRFGEGVELLTGHNSGSRRIFVDDADSLRDGGGGSRVVSGEHARGDSSPVALEDGRSGSGSRRVAGKELCGRERQSAELLAFSLRRFETH